MKNIIHKLIYKQIENYNHRRISVTIELMIVFTAFLMLYSFTISDNTSLSHDSSLYIYRIYSRIEIFHPHHLLYNGFAIIWAALLRIFGNTSDIEYLVSFLNSIFGAFTLSVFYLILRKRLRINILYSFLGTCLPAFSFGFWFYSGCVEVYIIPLFFLILLVYLLSSEHLNVKTFTIVGFIHGITILFHQAHLLFITVILLCAFLLHRRKTVSIYKSIVNYASSLVPTVAIPYLVVIFGILKLSSLLEIWNWLTLYGHNTSNWNSFSLITLVKAVIGFGRSIIGAHFVFAIPSFTILINGLFKGHWFIDEEFLVRNLDKYTAYILLIISSIFFLILTTKILFNCQYYRQVWNKQRNLILILIVWFITYGIFFFFWEPHNIEFWIPQSVCFWFLFVIMSLISKPSAKHFKRNSITYFTTIAIMIFTINFMGSIIFIKDKNNDYYYKKMDPIVKLAKQNDLVIVGRKWILKEYLLRNTEADVLCLAQVFVYASDSEEFIQQVQRVIDRTLDRGNTVFISGEAVELEENVISYIGNDTEPINKLWKTYFDKWKRLDFEVNTIYVLQPINY